MRRRHDVKFYFARLIWRDHRAFYKPIHLIKENMKNDRYEVKEEELPSDEYDNEINHWYVYDNETDSVVNNEWFDTEKRAQDYLELIEGQILQLEG
tara:strand:- start:176 stop:463 length:288 start_codon:yes stop_codon:yes gene_type:complete